MEENDDLTLAFKALRAAEKAFVDYIGKDGSNAAYFDYRFTAWLLDVNCEARLERVEIEREVKENK